MMTSYWKQVPVVIWLVSCDSWLQLSTVGLRQSEWDGSTKGKVTKSFFLIIKKF
jgi:hypothetical protein